MSRLTPDGLRAWLDRKPPPAVHYHMLDGRPWRDWFAADGAYLGTVSDRTGPDPVDAKQKKNGDWAASQPCPCEVCQATKVGFRATNGAHGTKDSTGDEK